VPGAKRAHQQDHRHAPQLGARPGRLPGRGPAHVQEHREELRRLAELRDADIGDNENNIRYNFIIPCLKTKALAMDLKAMLICH